MTYMGFSNTMDNAQLLRSKSINPSSSGMLQDDVRPGSRIPPDFSQYRQRLQTLSAKDLRLHKGGRMIVVGDIHGMKDPLDHLLHKLRFRPRKDTLVHTGDVVVKGPHSWQVLEYLAVNNVSGVRGNHDQKIIGWRTWFDWVRSFSDGQEWLDHYVDDRVETQELAPATIYGTEHPPQAVFPPSLSQPKGSKFPYPDDWEWASEHWKIARNMTDAQYQYLLGLPLVLHVPALHVVVAHAGVLPVDPTKAVSSVHQPLARLPVLSAKEKPEKLLRTAQELSVITDIPQNQDPWVNLNMRSVLNNGDVSKKNDQGTPWSALWHKVITRCAGFGSVRSHGRLPCLPFTVIYGHAASRGKELKKWTKGLDTGCVYGRKLTALVYSTTRPLEDGALDEDVSVETTSLGDNRGSAQVISVSCKHKK
ncbi:Metallo-dependent phosphatase [Clavulina sp. PMI_390]|nr:Metallo-dependent phosphatase [Clavulina sp. PMI_390]